MVQNVIVMNSSNYNKQNSNGNSFVYKFPREITFNPSDKIGIQSASIFNSFYNITSKLGNNKMSIVFPCNNPSGGQTAIMQCYIGNSVQFTGQVSNPPNLEISGSTINPSNTNTFTGFVGGNKIFFPNAYITGNTLFLKNVNTAPVGITVGMYINGTAVSITSINNTVNGANTTTTYTLSNSTLSPIGSSTTPVSTIFACGTGNNLYITTAKHFIIDFTQTNIQSGNQTGFCPGHPCCPGLPLQAFAHRGRVISTMPFALIQDAYSGKTFPVA